MRQPRSSVAQNKLNIPLSKLAKVTNTLPRSIATRNCSFALRSIVSLNAFLSAEE